jgi:hypothetical protein
MNTTTLPIPVLFNDGLPSDGDVDKDGNLWLWNDIVGDWEYVYIRTRVRADITRTYSQWLPFYDNPLEWNWE